MTLANSPLHIKQCFGVMRRKQSPLFREWAVGSIKRTWTCLRPTDKAPHTSLQPDFNECLNILVLWFINLKFLRNDTINTLESFPLTAVPSVMSFALHCKWLWVIDHRTSHLHSTTVYRKQTYSTFSCVSDLWCEWAWACWKAVRCCWSQRRWTSHCAGWPCGSSPCWRGPPRPHQPGLF